MRTIIALLIWPLALITFLLVGGIVLLAILFLPRERLHPLIRVSCRLILLASGQLLKVKYEQTDLGPEPYIYMFNHASLFDVFIVGAIAKHYLTAVGAEYQFSYPVWGTLIKRHGIIPIIRTNVRKAIASLEKAEEALESGTSFLISPEGTRTLTGELQIFKKGGFHVAKHTGATIVPMGFIGTFSAKPKIDWRIKPGVLLAQIGRPIRAEDYQDMSVEELRDLVRGKIKILADGKLE